MTLKQPRYLEPNAALVPGSFDANSLKGKTVVLTGGGSGIGEAVTRAFVKNGAFVVFNDISYERGNKVIQELFPNVVFVPGDVTIWQDQVTLFKEAMSRSPNGNIDIVFANAGTAFQEGDNNLNAEPDENGEPTKPGTRMIDINLTAQLYTIKLAQHHWRSPLQDNQDRSLIITASIAGYVDFPDDAQYAATKWAMRGVMRSLRARFAGSGIRANLVAPWYIKTNILSHKDWDAAQAQRDITFADVEDAATAVMHIAADTSVHGRGLGVLPRQDVEHGYIDLRRDEKDIEIEGSNKWHRE